MPMIPQDMDMCRAFDKKRRKEARQQRKQNKQEPISKTKSNGCLHANLESGYGLAGGGIGVYMYCVDCGQITDKVQTD